MHKKGKPMKLFELANFIPSIPKNLIITDIEELYKRPNAFDDSGEWDWWYFTTKVDDKLYNFLQPYFDFPIEVYYQLSGRQLTPHIDQGRTFCYNYTLLPGGPEVRTRWYDDNMENIIYEIEAPLFTWHRLQVDVPHDISEIESHRLSLTIQAAKNEENNNR
jgi:hypothetical protein